MLILQLQYVHAGLQNLKMHAPASLLGNYCYYLFYTFNKVQETLFRGFGPYWHDSITMQIFWLYIYDANLQLTTSCNFIDTILLFATRQAGS